MALTGKIFSKPEPGKFVGVLFERGCVSTLLAATRTGLPLRRRRSRDFAVERHDAFLHVDDEDDDVRGFDGQFHLFERGLDDDVVGFFAAQQADAAGVHEREGVSAAIRPRR